MILERYRRAVRDCPGQGEGAQHGQVRSQVDDALAELGNAWLDPTGHVDVSAIPPQELLDGLTAAVRALMVRVRLLVDEVEFR